MPFIMVTVLIDMMSIGLIIPVLPALVGTLHRRRSRAGVRGTALVTFAFGIANFIGSPILGALSDRFGRRPVLLVGFCGAGAQLLRHRARDGAVDADRGAPVQRRDAGQHRRSPTPTSPTSRRPSDRAKRFGLLGAMFGLGFILGPVIGGLLGGIDLHLPFFAAGALALLNLLYGWFVLPESLPPERRRPFGWARAQSGRRR